MADQRSPTLLRFEAGLSPNDDSVEVDRKDVSWTLEQHPMNTFNLYNSTNQQRVSWFIPPDKNQESRYFIKS